jgi:hypothetical protein
VARFVCRHSVFCLATVVSNKAAATVVAAGAATTAEEATVVVGLGLGLLRTKWRRISGTVHLVFGSQTQSTVLHGDHGENDD